MPSRIMYHFGGIVSYRALSPVSKNHLILHSISCIRYRPLSLSIICTRSITGRKVVGWWPDPFTTIRDGNKPQIIREPIPGMYLGDANVPLNATQVKTKKPGAHADGGGLYLHVREGGERIWAFRFTARDGKRAVMEFAAVGQLTLSEARDQARAYRLALKRDGVDPRHKKRIDAKGGMTFKAFADEQYPARCKGLSDEEEKQWKRSIDDVKSLHHLKLHEITTEDVLKALKPVWTVKPVTASRTRQRIERLLDAAKALRYREGENPAIWRGNLKHLLTSPRRLHKKRGHASVPWAKAPLLMVELHNDPGPVARCAEVGILTVARSQEIRLMEWTELDFEKKTWLCPAEKMKIKGDDEPRSDVVPLSDQTVMIIKSVPRLGRYVFPSDHASEHQPFRPNALTNCIKRAGFKATMHGMRTTFRNWGGESKEHNFRREVLEHCLSHRVGDESERSYWTGEMMERRREVLEAWSNYVRPKAKLKSRTGRAEPVTHGGDRPQLGAATREPFAQRKGRRPPETKKPRQTVRSGDVEADQQ
jgi:integrase-like protein/Arm domain-containing DNA-binding protein